LIRGGEGAVILIVGGCGLEEEDGVSIGGNGGDDIFITKRINLINIKNVPFFFFVFIVLAFLISFRVPELPRLGLLRRN
jgi:hypothetical protein